VTPDMTPAVLLPFASRGWEIKAYPAGLAVYTAERVRGTEVRFLVATDPAELAAKLEAADRDVTP
jgi:hypothetical protein